VLPRTFQLNLRPGRFATGRGGREEDVVRKGEGSKVGKRKRDGSEGRKGNLLHSS